MQARYRLDPLPGLGPYLPIILADRFHLNPFTLEADLDEIPVIAFDRLMRILALEAEISQHIEKLPTDEPIIWE